MNDIKTIGDLAGRLRSLLPACGPNDDFVITNAEAKMLVAAFPLDFRGRLFDEDHELRSRIEKLKAFIIGDQYDKLPEIDRTDLKEQLKYMEAYASVLSRRVSRQCGNA